MKNERDHQPDLIKETGSPRDPHEGIDYIVDHYSVLKVSPTAELDEIRAMYRKQVAQYHPDRFVNLAPEFQTRAEDMTRILNRSYEVLSHEITRAEFDEKLNTWDGQISTSGHPIEMVGGTRSTATRLIEGFDSAEEALENMIGLAQNMSGYSHEMYTFIEEQFTQSDEPSQSLQQAYREALSKRDIYLSVVEGFRRDLIGLKTDSMKDPSSDYAKDVSQDLANHRDLITESVHDTLFQLQTGALFMLEAGENSETHNNTLAIDSPETLEKLRAEALQRFDSQAELIQDLANNRQDVIRKRLAQVKGEYPFDQQEIYQKALLRFESGTNTLWIGFEIIGDQALFDMRFDLNNMLTEDQIQDLLTNGQNVIHYNAQEGLNMLEEIDQIINAHAEKYEMYQQQQTDNDAI